MPLPPTNDKALQKRIVVRISRLGETSLVGCPEFLSSLLPASNEHSATRLYLPSLTRQIFPMDSLSDRVVRTGQDLSGRGKGGSVVSARPRYRSVYCFRSDTALNFKKIKVSTRLAATLAFSMTWPTFENVSCSEYEPALPQTKRGRHCRHAFSATTAIASH
jgi:hypothetical protein